MARGLDLTQVIERVTRPDEPARQAARQRLVESTGGATLGRLEDLAVWLAGVQAQSPTRPLERSRLLVVAGDHGIAAAGVSGPAEENATSALARLTEGTATVSMLAATVDVPVRVLDLSTVASDRIDTGDAIAREQAERAFAMGVALADEEIDSGTDLLVCGHVGAGATTVAAVIIGALTRGDAASVCGFGSGLDDATWIRRCTAVRDALRRARQVLGDQIGLLASSGGADFAALTGLLLQAAARRTPVLIDGVVAAASALVAHRIAFRAADWWLAGDLSDEPAHAMALDRISLEPVHTLGVGRHDGSGALLAVPILRAAATVLGR